ncbi:MAG: cell division protein FtsA [Patescibacteria group bacterium]
MSKIHIITGLDIGTTSTKVLVARKLPDREDLEVLSKIEEPSFGVRKGVIFNTDNVAEISQVAKKKAEEESGRKIDSVYVNIGGSHIFSTFCHGLVSVSRADKKISMEDVERVLQAAQAASLVSSNKEILKTLPKEFIVDGESGLKDVVGMEGMRLEADVLTVGVFSPYLKNLTRAVSNADFQINDITPSILASARAVLKKKEKELGVVLVEIGAGTTGIAVFSEGELAHAIVLPIGSAHITNDIAVGLKIDVDLAEKIKMEFGNCLHRGSDKKEKIELEDEFLVFSHKEIADIVGSRVAEIFSEVNKELKNISKQGQLPGGVVLTGGGAKLPKITELARKELKLHCRIGKPHGFSPEQDDISLSTVCGLVLGGQDLEEDGGFSGGFSVSLGGGVGSRIKKLFRIFLP